MIMERPKRIYFLDFLKSIAIVFVVFYHSMIYSCDIVNGSLFLNGVHYFFSALLSVCVPLFFFVSGYLLFSKSFVLRKHIKKTMILILLTLVWAVILLFLFMYIKKNPLSLKQFIEYLLSFKTGWINLLWFMGALVCIYFLFPILKVVFDCDKKIFLYFVLLCFLFTFGNRFMGMCATVVNGIVRGGVQEVRFNFFLIFNPFTGSYGYTFFYFCLGGLCFAYQEKIHNYVTSKNKKIAFGVFIISLLLLTMYGMFCTFLTREVYDIVWNGYDTIFTFIHVFILYFWSLDVKENQNHMFTKLITLLSSNTLGIYFTHEIFIHLTKSYLQNIPFLNSIFFNMLYAFWIIAMSLLVVFVTKKIPVLQKLLKY